MVQLAALIFLASIACFFAQEIIQFVKKIFAIKGAVVAIPIALASCAVYIFSLWLLWALYYIREVLQEVLNLLKSILPFGTWQEPIALIVLLTIVSVVPVILVDQLSRYRTHKNYEYPYTTSTIIWLICVTTLFAV